MKPGYIKPGTYLRIKHSHTVHVQFVNLTSFPSTYDEHMTNHSSGKRWINILSHRQTKCVWITNMNHKEKLIHTAYKYPFTFVQKINMFLFVIICLLTVRVCFIYSTQTYPHLQTFGFLTILDLYANSLVCKCAPAFMILPKQKEIVWYGDTWNHQWQKNSAGKYRYKKYR